MAAKRGLTLQGLTAMNKLFNVQLARFMNDPGQRHRDAGLIGLRSIRENFEAGGRPERWDELATGGVRSFLFRKQKPGKRGRDYSGKRAQRMIAGKKILILTGKMMRSVRVRFSKNRLEFYSAVPYGPLHQEGDEARNIPARPWMLLLSEDADAILQVWNHGLGEALKA